jgi:sugar/nucleoside kinase (ribokinase family)
MDRKYDVMVAGHLCVDIIPAFSDTGATRIADILRPGKLVNVGAATLSTGGTVSNTGIALQTLGNKVCFAARVGDDAFGRLTTDLLNRSGSVEGIRVEPGSASSYTIVIAPPNIDRIFLHNPGTNDEFSPADLDPELIAQCRHFHFGYPPLMRRMYDDDGTTLHRVFKIAHDAGASTSCDMALPDPDSPAGRVDWLPILERCMPEIDLFLASAEETLYMVEPETFAARRDEHGDADLVQNLEPEDYSRIAERLIGMGARVVSLKSGPRGFYVRTAAKEAFAAADRSYPVDVNKWAGRELWAPAWAVETFGSATGAGDSSIAGFLSTYVRGLPIEKALKCAVCCGWQNVQAVDAVSGVGSWDTTMELVEQDMPTIDPLIDSPGWSYSTATGMWSGPGDRANVG